MIKENMESLVSQVLAYHNATMAKYTGEADKAIEGKLASFSSRFMGNSRSYQLTTRESLEVVAKEMFASQEVVDYVLGMRLVSLSIFTSEEIIDFCNSFALANVSSPVEDSQMSVLPTDDDYWKSKPDTVAKLYRANLWIIPLLALGLIEIWTVEDGEG